MTIRPDLIAFWVRKRKHLAFAGEVFQRSVRILFTRSFADHIGEDLRNRQLRRFNPEPFLSDRLMSSGSSLTKSDLCRSHLYESDLCKSELAPGIAVFVVTFVTRLVRQQSAHG